MKKVIFSGVFCLISVLQIAAQKATDVIMTVAGQPVTLEEFRYIYEKNNGSSADYSKASLKEYIELYSKFKLKVAKAKDLRMDTISALQEELAGYKRQLANSYLMEKEVLDHLIKDLRKRMKTDVKISHIFTASGPRDSKDSDAMAREKIETVLKKLQAGESFEALAAQYSMDKNNANKGGELGYFTAMMPAGFHELEDAMYNTPIGSYSGIVKSRIGYHIIRVDAVRPARGSISVAHILVRKDTPKAMEIINAALNEINGGLSFEEAVLKYSEDSNTKNIKGILPEMRINTYEISFEDAAFSLQHDGDISSIVETSLGYHILKRVSKADEVDDVTFKKINEPKIKKDERYEAARQNLIEDIKKAGDYKMEKSVFDRFAASLDDTFLTYKWAPNDSPLMSEKLFSFGGNAVYTAGDFAEFCRKNTRTRLRYDKTETGPVDVAGILYEDFVREKAIDFEQSNLEMKYADFRSLMREYEEGILLFEVTKDAVWDRANEDTTGLKAFYENNKHKYLGEEKADLEFVFIQTDDKDLADKIRKYIEKKGFDKAVKKYNKDGEVITRYAEKLNRSNQQFAGMTWKAGYSTPTEKDQKANRYVYKTILQTYPESVKTLQEARGYVVADYQDYLEANWIKSLKKEYSIVIHDDVLQSITK